MVFDIERFATREGPGIRTAVFLKRCPMIPGVNDFKQNLVALRKLADELEGVSEIDIEPYVPYGIDKAHKLGLKVMRLRLRKVSMALILSVVFRC